MKSRNISKRKGWTILMVDVNGQIKTIKFLRTKMLFGMFICALAVLSTMIIGQMYAHVLKENKELFETLAIKKAVFGEKGIIRMPCYQPENDYQISFKADNYSLFWPNISDGNPFQLPLNFNVSETLDVIPDIQPETVSNGNYDQKVQATDIRMLINQKNNRIGFSFMLRNAAKAKKAISGTSFVVLKNDDDNDSIAYPSIKLRRDRPVNFRKGRPFYVARFKTVRHRLDDIENVEKYTQATVLVYSQHGHLLIDKTIPLYMSF
ncbi:MAG: hypothetical protein HQK75_02205 [Candidatus Magnetomorum sp.]|nr:hypothetical protein [Candidatus Magnetomorum sp.]